MKKLFFNSLFLLLVTSIFAQNIHVGFTAGTSIANYKVKVDGEDESSDSKAGFTAGVLIDIPAGKNFSFQPALNFVQKGTKEKQGSEKITLSMNAIEVPLNLLYNSNGEAGNFFIGAGPSLGFNISGKLKYDDGEDTFKEDVEIGNDPDNDFIKGLDLGANVLAGYQFPNGLFISANYNLGLNNLFPGGSDDGTLKSRYFGFKLGWMLQSKSKK